MHSKAAPAATATTDATATTTDKAADTKTVETLRQQTTAADITTNTATPATTDRAAVEQNGKDNRNTSCSVRQIQRLQWLKPNLRY